MLKTKTDFGSTKATVVC